MSDYSIVVQECFQVRCRDYLETVCKDEFKLKHFWCRFEFAKSRGQIHAHLLAITDDATDGGGINAALHANKGDREAQAALLATWARDTFWMTAEHPSDELTGRE